MSLPPSGQHSRDKEMMKVLMTKRELDAARATAADIGCSLSEFVRDCVRHGVRDWRQIDGI